MCAAGHNGREDIMEDEFEGEPSETAAATPPSRVPVAALQAERNRRQSAERERDEWRMRYEALGEPTGDAKGPPVGDPFAVVHHPTAEDLDEAFAAPDPVDLTDLNDRLNAAEAMARRTHGDAAVEAAHAWAARAMREDPSMADTILARGDAFDWLVSQAMQHRGDLRPDHEAERSALPPPRSLANAPSAGGAAHTPAGPGQAFDALFVR